MHDGVVVFGAPVVFGDQHPVPTDSFVLKADNHAVALSGPISGAKFAFGETPKLAQLSMDEVERDLLRGLAQIHDSQLVALWLHPFSDRFLLEGLWDERPVGCQLQEKMVTGPSEKGPQPLPR